MIEETINNITSAILCLDICRFSDDQDQAQYMYGTKTYHIRDNKLFWILIWISVLHLGQVTKVWLSCYLVLLSFDNKTR